MKYYVRMKETNYYNLLIDADDKLEAIAKAYEKSFMNMDVSEDGGMEPEKVCELYDFTKDNQT